MTAAMAAAAAAALVSLLLWGLFVRPRRCEHCGAHPARRGAVRPSADLLALLAMTRHPDPDLAVALELLRRKVKAAAEGSKR